MAEGTVKWFSNKRDMVLSSRKMVMTCSFIILRSTCPDSKTLSEGDRVSFEVEDSDRGPKAKNVVKV